MPRGMRRRWRRKWNKYPDVGDEDKENLLSSAGNLRGPDTGRPPLTDGTDAESPVCGDERVRVLSERFRVRSTQYMNTD